MKNLRKNKYMGILACCSLVFLISCSKEEAPTATPVVPVVQDPAASINVTIGTAPVYVGQLMAQYDDFLKKQVPFAQLAQEFYNNPSDLSMVAPIEVAVEELMEVILHTENLTPPESLVAEHKELVLAAYRLAEVLEEYAEYYTGSLEFASEKQQKMYTGLTTYYSGKSHDYINLLDEIATKT